MWGGSAMRGLDAGIPCVMSRVFLLASQSGVSVMALNVLESGLTSKRTWGQKFHFVVPRQSQLQCFRDRKYEKGLLSARPFTWSTSCLLNTPEMETEKKKKSVLSCCRLPRPARVIYNRLSQRWPSVLKDHTFTSCASKATERLFSECIERDRKWVSKFWSFNDVTVLCSLPPDAGGSLRSALLKLTIHWLGSSLSFVTSSQLARSEALVRADSSSPQKGKDASLCVSVFSLSLSLSLSVTLCSINCGY